ncbi:MAG: Na/Pi cotransporter family protein, partial [Clostridia bacterium]|nr:Na/Pi cotransporter family protein [Clostridia bacterium]
MSIFYTIITILAGLGISLYGFKVLREGMETSLGSGFKKVIGKVANNKWASYALSAGVTGAWQSTTLTTSMISSFLNVGNVTLSQGIALMLGVQLGSSLAIILVAFQAIDLMKILSILCVVGAFLFMFGRNYKMRKTAISIMGFGLLFAGISMLGDGVGVLVNAPKVYDAISVMTNPFVLLIIGAIFNIVTNSMYATVTIITALVGVYGGGPLSMMSGVYMLVGAVAAGGVMPMFYCISGSSRETKAMLLGYNVFKIIASIIFMLLCLIPWLGPFYELLGHQSGVFYVLLYIIMMFVPGILILLFNKPFAKLMLKMIPTRRKTTSIYDSFVIDEKNLNV